MALSAQAQASFMDVLDTLATELRSLFLEENLIQKVAINHRATWSEFKGVPIGSLTEVWQTSRRWVPRRSHPGRFYCVIPGRVGEGRERFNFEIQLVDDLYESGSGGAAVYEDVFDDVAKMRDAARIVCETAGLLSLTTSENPPSIALLHGPLVNLFRPMRSERLVLATPFQILQERLSETSCGRYRASFWERRKFRCCLSKSA